MWRFQLSVGAASLAGLPPLNAYTTDTHLGVPLFGPAGLRPVAGFDLMMLVLGNLLGLSGFDYENSESIRDEALIVSAAFVAHGSQVRSRKR